LGSIRPSSAPTHLRRTRAVPIYRRTGNLHAVEILLGHFKVESTIHYSASDVDDEIEIAEKIDI
jgi:site-specific recombinase XerC